MPETRGSIKNDGPMELIAKFDIDGNEYTFTARTEIPIGGVFQSDEVILLYQDPEELLPESIPFDGQSHGDGFELQIANGVRMVGVATSGGFPPLPIVGEGSWARS
ncbi:hypothetical protein FGRMN_10295 [Fusarium graminum]|nr:hypothetical protein FGRMN_10295 [Fusarium graminum]